MVTYCQAWCYECGYHIIEKFPWVEKCPKCGCAILVNNPSDPIVDFLLDCWGIKKDKGNNE